MKNIIIIGPPRSGTSLISGITTGNEDSIPNIPECTYITQIIEHFFNIINYSDKERFRIYAKDYSTLEKVYKEHVNRMISVVLDPFKSHNYEYLTLKDPELTIYIDLIPSFFKNPKIIFMLRDPRSTISSMVKVQQKKEHSSTSLNRKTLVEEVAISIYNYFYIMHQSEVYKNNQLCLIRYENIIAKDEEEFLKLEQFIGYTISRRPFERSAFSFDKKDATYSKNYGKDIINKKKDFAQTLTKNDIKTIESMFSGYNELYKWW